LTSKRALSEDPKSLGRGLRTYQASTSAMTSSSRELVFRVLENRAEWKKTGRRLDDLDGLQGTPIADALRALHACGAEAVEFSHGCCVAINAVRQDQRVEIGQRLPVQDQ
jgi:hypothetical protein